MNIIFFGTPDFAATILEELIKHNFKPVLVVAPSDKPVGREQTMTPPPTKVLAQRYLIPVIQPEVLETDDFRQVFSNSNPDLVVLAAYGPPFLTKEFLQIPRYGCLNVHPSLLPKFRGASPIPHQILAGEKETGATIIRMSEKIDQGDIVGQEKTEIALSDTTETLSKKLADLGGRLLVRTIPLLLEGRIAPKPQPLESPTPYCRQLKKEDGKIDWLNPADYIERQIRAFDPWPGAYAKLKAKNEKLKIIKILKSETFSCRNDKQPGEVFLTESGQLAVKAGQNCLIVEKLQLEGKKPLSAIEFLHGRQDIVGTVLN